jgi:hypothetical protein
LNVSYLREFFQWRLKTSKKRIEAVIA